MQDGPFDLRKRYAGRRVDALTRFHESYIPVPMCGCWIWIGTERGWGYGGIQVNHVNIFAHRYSYLIHKGEIPVGMFVCHKCDVRFCVNPDHLFLGTRDDNMRDMVEKNRQSKGSRHTISKITEQDVLRIREMREHGMKLSEIAKTFGISFQSVHLIAARKQWRHVP